MPKFSKPWHRKGRGWYVTLDGSQIPLSKDRTEAFARYHELMAKPRSKPVQDGSVAVLVDSFLEWVQKHKSEATYIWYKHPLQLFCQRYPTLLVRELKNFHVQQWIDSYEVARGTKRNYARTIVRAMSWCEEQGRIDRSPLAHFKKPRGNIRDVVISPEEFTIILSHIKRRPFRDLLSFAWETGARASECLALEERHVDLANHRVVFPISEEKMHRAPRIIFLNHEAEAIITRLMKVHSNHLFRNTDGLPWTTDAVNCGFIRLKTKLGRKLCLTVLRHSWCHRMLRSGVDALTVSVLMGHADPSMIARVYSHLTQAPGHLLEAVRKATA